MDFIKASISEGREVNAYHHLSVMTDVVAQLMNVRPSGLYVDATLGGGGHSEVILKRGGRVFAIDLDDDAIGFSRRLKDEYGDRFNAVKGNFKDVDRILKNNDIEKVDGLIADLGLSSNQLENGRRGFSFSDSSPLDMRFDTSKGVTAYELMSQIETDELAKALSDFADIRKAEKVARYLKIYFEKSMPNNALEFAEYVRGCRYLERSRRIDPATRIFMAIRMMVNDEVGNLITFLGSIPAIVNEGAVVVVISFHSVEDRIVKTFFRRFTKDSFKMSGLNLSAELINKKVIFASEEEIRNNPGARSARLRAIRFFKSE